MKKLCLVLISAMLLLLFSGTAAAAPENRFNMSYIYYGNSSSYVSLVDRTKNSLSEVAPNYFTLDGSGSLTMTSAVSQAFIDGMHARGIRVVPYLTNDWDRQTGINALVNREALSEQLAQAVTTYKLDGVNVDLENLTEKQRTELVDFVRLLREKLPAGKTLAVAVAVNPNGAVTGWQGSYDYTGLAQFSDYLMLMAYDEHYYGGAAGPVSGMPFIEASLRYALKLVPKDKLVLGLPFYGRIWSDSGGYPKGYGVSNTKITQLLANYGGAVTVDGGSQSAVATITVAPDKSGPVIGGKALAAGTYTIWYENEETLKKRLDLVSKYDLKGAGSWSLGQEDTATWDYYTLRLNGCPFGDIGGNWARDDIVNAYFNGWVQGASPEAFSPDAPLTRAEAAAMLVRMLGYPAEAAGDDGFDDVGGGWAEAYITTARRNGIISGTGGNCFTPDRPVTRQEMAVMLHNILGGAAAGRQPDFPDVTPAGNPWSYAAIAALSDIGIFTGFPDGSFRPCETISRAEMAALMTRMQRA